MKVKAAQINLFWSNESENKPSREFIDSITFTTLDQGMSYKDQHTAEVILDYNQDYNYTFWDNKYWYKVREIKKTKTTIRYEFVVDFYATYFKLTNADSASVVRSHVRDQNSFMYKDSLMDQVPVKYDKRTTKVAKYPYYLNDSTNITYRFKLKNYSLPSDIKYGNLKVEKASLSNRNLYYIFTGTGDTAAKGAGKFFFIPLLTTKKGKLSLQVDGATGTFSPKNSYEELEILRKSSDGVNLFQGVYSLPNFLSFKDDISFISSTAGVDFREILAVAYDGEFLPIEMTKLTFPLDNNNYDSYESLRVQTPILYNSYKLSYYGNELDINYSKEYANLADIEFKGTFMYPGQGIVSIARRYENIEDTMLTYSGQLPVPINEYLVYANGISAGVNNSIRAQGINSFAGMGAGLVNSGIQAASGNFVGAVTGGLSSIGSGFHAMQQQKKSLEAQFTDLRKTKTTSISASNLEDAAYIGLPVDDVDKGEFLEMFQLLEPDSHSKRLLNNVTYFYGSINPKKEGFAKLTQRSLFNYIEFNKQWLDDYISVIPNIDWNTKNMIFSALSNGIRIWKQVPNPLTGYGNNIFPANKSELGVPNEEK